MRLSELLFSQGFGTRRVCAGLVEQGLVRLGERRCTDPSAEVDLSAGPLRYEVQGQAWTYHPRAYLMLHKPAGFECSHRPGRWPSVYTLLPAPLRQRPTAGKVAGVQAVGRLDQDTTGLLLLSDDGAFIHRMNAPRRHVPKVYEVGTRHPLDERQLERLRSGVVLDDDPRPVVAAAAEASGERQLRLTLTEGKYHQVKRMLAAVGNRVETLHRSRIGGLSLPAELAPGQWRWLEPSELDLLRP
ncbi:MAG: 16S rRNA pseudouridine(516) synthase [Rubrivivax sp.]|mgnify:FL=1|uniref:pseudouridine synthase n=1 Tax=Ottowia sp. TaxID=1898956 RepID=UPI00217B6CD3|nr:pseudouridine synthase [Ottowia sp.]MCC6813352.1 16S rRNA pseudouridine(516) synthase [Rubrivivax sp.]MCZ2089031.1 pseudouridine synthase [Burkholderiales bacterium]HNR82857.1 pseudouridine synthase [Ottowia sp.]HNT84191.1 pseudouridine synthase [Ottowia sp.]